MVLPKERLSQPVSWWAPYTTQPHLLRELGLGSRMAKFYRWCHWRRNKGCGPCRKGPSNCPAESISSSSSRCSVWICKYWESCTL
jgi:hypothetical protein